MDIPWIIIGSFLIGSVGALFIVWLRWSGSLLKFSSFIELDKIEDDYKELSSSIATKLKSGKEVTKAEVLHSDNLRDDIWRQRTRAFLASALLYVILGGATAVLFVGFEITDILKSEVIVKLLSAGALWSSFYSFVDIKKADEKAQDIRDKQDTEAVKKLKNLQKPLKKKKRKN